MAWSSTIFVSICVAASAVVFSNFFQVNLFRKYFPWFLTEPSGNNTVDIVIGILSARHNFEQRQSLRNAWVGHIQEQNLSAVVKFIIGNEDCPIPHEYRTSAYSCKPSSITTEAISDTVIAVSSKDSPQDEGINVPFPSRISFRIQHPIIIGRLGVFCKDGSKGLTTPVSVTLVDDTNMRYVVQVHFTPDSAGVQVGDYLFKPIESFILPKGFEGSILATSLSENVRWMSGPQIPVTMETGGNVITYLQRNWSEQATEHDFHLSFEYNLSNHPLCNFMFLIHEPEDLFALEKQKREKYHQWSDEMTVIQTRLEEEAGQHGDIIQVDTMDFYDNIPMKMLLFHKWLSSFVNFRYFIKTDDDCFLNIERITKVLKEDTFVMSKVWWGNFRYNFPLVKQGKWRELYYPSEAFPAFACGSGNVISEDIVQWIASNSKYLHPFQGEDVSLAIWLAAIHPTYMDDKRWICNGDCHPDMLASAEHSVEEINELWRNWVDCGNPCDCKH